MRPSRLLPIVVIIGVLAPLSAQRQHHQPSVVFTDESRMPAATNAHPDSNLMLQQANDLKQLSDGIPGDIENVSKGIIAKDLAERLKKIEKLSKKLREEVQQ